MTRIIRKVKKRIKCHMLSSAYLCYVQMVVFKLHL